MTFGELLPFARQYSSYASAIRHELHQNPELGLKETKTTAIIRRELDKLDLEYQDIGMTVGIVALIKGTKPGKGGCIAIRADIDALPIEDISGAEYASKNNGICHACGHDGHTAILIGTAKALCSLRDQFSGTVKLIFQPGEEGLDGAKIMIGKGVLETPHVDSMIALHGQPAYPTGKIAVSPGKIMASSDTFCITYHGKSAHASRPVEGRNALIPACYSVLALQEVVANEISTREQAVVNTTVMHSGTASNVIPDEAVLKGTVRCLDPAIRDKCEAAIRRIGKSTAEMSGCTADIEYSRGIPPLANNPEMAEKIRQAAMKTVGGENVIPLPAVLGGEDFSYYTEVLDRTGYYRVGCAYPDSPGQPMLHTGGFNFNDEAIPYGIAVHVAYVLQENG